ncbi:MAG: NUDIX hydrolase [Opitutales bacterium]|nr:NUDIX hydrolase [Opitutales bacterium]
MEILPFKISVLIFVRDGQGRHLMIRRKKAPNQNCWSPIGGKLEMAIGESPFECACREAKEEVGIDLVPADLHLFGMVSERGYEGSGHWLMFLFDCKKTMNRVPATIDEGNFEFFEREEIDKIAIPPSDNILVWPVYDKYARAGTFCAYRAQCGGNSLPERIVDEEIGVPGQ